jgi:hypothetical protein
MHTPIDVINGSFVVQFRGDTDIDAGRIDGRVEHIYSARAIRFHSLEQLLMFFKRILDDVRDRDAHATDRLADA